MPSGIKTLTMNTAERAVSTDINRLQAFSANGLAEMMRYLIDVDGNDDLDAGSVMTEHTTLDTPARAEILNGLLVKPQAGTLNLLVDKGVMFAIVPDTDPDASPYKYVADPGVLVLGTLALTANASGSTRIDVIECQVTSSILESDNRDIFNPVTGLFTAATVTKAVAATLGYRVRAGTPGSGYPAAVSGWIQLAVASVPTGTTTCDTVTFWDVRPLITDRAHGPAHLRVATPRIRKHQIDATAPAAVTGLLDADLNSRRVGGRIRTGSVATDAQSIDLTIAANRDPTFSLVANRPWYLYLCTPFGLPRWARYTDGPSGRLPRSPRGIPIASTVSPDTDGKPSATIAMPTLTGLVGSATTAEAVCVAAGYADSGAVQRGFFGDDHGHILFTTTDGPHAGPTGALVNPIELFTALVLGTSGGAGEATASFTVTPGSHFAPSARALYVEIRADMGISVAPSYIQVRLRVFKPGTSTQISAEQQLTIPFTTPTASSAGQIIQFTRWLPVVSVYPSTSPATLRYDFLFNANGNIDTVANCYMRVLGWRL